MNWRKRFSENMQADDHLATFDYILNPLSAKCAYFFKETTFIYRGNLTDDNDACFGKVGGPFLQHHIPGHVW